MAPKKEEKVPTLKGQDAEDAVLQYMLNMNRPFGSTDVATNLHNSVPKTQVVKILASLAEKGALSMKPYGKVIIYVANQANMDTLSKEDCDALEKQAKDLEERQKELNVELKTASSDLSRVKSAYTEEEMAQRTTECEEKVQRLQALLEPLRNGAPLLSEAELAKIDADVKRWKKEWLNRRKVFQQFWGSITESMPPQESNELREDLDIEGDSPEHIQLEKRLNAKGPARLARKASRQRGAM
ncbi:TBPIP-domain-containing protein [Peniophora sp. CONT]|nr:TBPIP-domain-containing protein [Peniophora sp. CONT]